MKTTLKVLALAAALSVAAPFALASTITIESYGTNLNDGSTNSTPAGISNTAMIWNNAGVPTATYDIPTVLPWANLTDQSASSSWVSYDPGTWVGGPTVAANGENFIYHTTFLGAIGDSGSITVLADDTTSVVLNGHQVVGQADPDAATNCTVGKPNCVVATTFTLDASYFVDGTNNLKFVVAQDFGSATGVDFVGTVSSIGSNVASTPEPSSLLLLGTGLLTTVGVARRKFKM